MVQNSPCHRGGGQSAQLGPTILRAALNLMTAVRTAAECDIAEVMLCMFGPTSDN